VTVNCTSTGISASSSSTFCHCTCTTSTSSTFTFSKVKPCLIICRCYEKLNDTVPKLQKCHIVIHRVPVNLIN
jgi:hypothetical protein